MSGADDGIFLVNIGAGTIDLKAYGNVTSTTKTGIEVDSENGVGISVLTTGIVTGGYSGIDADLRNGASGSLSITVGRKSNWV